jgi:hypothetical protein
LVQKRLLLSAPGGRDGHCMFIALAPGGSAALGRFFAEVIEQE